jgi:hypothetical protein
MSKKWGIRLVLLFIALAGLSLAMAFTQGEETQAPKVSLQESTCITCHLIESPGIVSQWLESKMSATLDCAICHGVEHTTADDPDDAKIPTPDTCAPCHSTQVASYRMGKHAIAWTAMNAMPMINHQPAAVVGPDGYKGCSGCHKIGERTAAEIATGEFLYGTAACDSCHTRHLFSKAEAQDPRACQTCHLGFDHPQWEMWSTSKHGTIWQIDGGSTRAPKCQDCHLPGGTHNNITAWGFLGLRVPEEDADWWADRVVILKAIGVLDENGEGTERLDAVAAARIARLTKEEFDIERNKMLPICEGCHAVDFVAQQFDASESLLREADAFMAEAITVVNELYTDGYLDTPEGWGYAPDLLQFYDNHSAIENELFTMFLSYRQRTFQGAFHINPDYMYWYGYAPMQKSLQLIKHEAEVIRATTSPASGNDTLGIIALAVGGLALLVAVAAIFRKRARDQA